MRKIVLMATLTATVGAILAAAFSAEANTYVDPKKRFDAKSFFDSLPSGQ